MIMIIIIVIYNNNDDNDNDNNKGTNLYGIKLQHCWFGVSEVKATYIVLEIKKASYWLLSSNKKTKTN